MYFNGLTMIEKKDRVLRPDQVSEILKVSRRTVYRLVAEGELEAFRVRGSLRIRESAVRAYVRRQIALFQRETGVAEDSVPNVT